MRPRRLRLQGFGAFPGSETVELDELARLGLFLVNGPTGSGKTTLLDAMAFALYGDLPAGRPLGEVRSHHAGPTERCEVELTFTVEDGTFRVRRSPEQERPKRRGPGVTVEPATAELHRVEPDGVEVPLASGTRPVTERCVALVGLDAGQFERVVLLPQGRFQRFLLADTKDRRPLLQKLFGTGLYRDAVEELKRRAVELRRQVADVDAEVARHRRNAREHLRTVAAGLADPGLDAVEPDDDVELLEAFWEKLAPAVEEVGRGADELAARAAEATGTARTAAEVAKRWDRRRALTEHHERLAGEQPAVDRLREALAAAERAAPVVSAAVALDRAEQAEQRAEEAVRRARAELADRLAAGELDEVRAGDGGPDVDAADRALGVAVVELERVAGLLGDLADARAEHERRAADQARLEARRGRAVEEQRRLGAERAEVAARIAGLEPVAAGGPAATARAHDASRRLEGRRRIEQRRRELARTESEHTRAESQLGEVLAAYVAGAAPRLAAALVPGEGCPVCGSVEHPAPAVGDGAEAPGLDRVEAAQQQASAASSALASLRSGLAELVADLGSDAERPVAEVEAEHTRAAADAEAAATATEQLVVLRGALEAATVRADELAAELDRLAVERAGVDAAVAGLATRVDELARTVGDADPARLARQGRALAAGSEAVTSCRRAEAERVGAEGARAEAAAGLAHELAASGLPDLDTARRAAMGDAERHAAARRLARHDGALAEVRGGLAALDEAELPDERPDDRALESAAIELRRRAQHERARVERLLERGEAAQLAVAEARRTDDRAAGLRDVHERTERVAALCDGQGPGKVGLEAWVLAGELERVTAAANVHLGRMSAGRYQLLRTDDAGHRAKQAGLDLTVLDSHTGRSRPPATLSGGEQFQASLSLALGLADVVSLGGAGSGRRFEALFVDEGFGSLDPEALDQAVEALHQIHASGRMVGVVTHVEAMKQQLPTGVEVHRRPDGRGSTLIPPARSPG